MELSARYKEYENAIVDVRCNVEAIAEFNIEIIWNLMTISLRLLVLP